MDKTINNKAWFLVLPVFISVAFSAIMPLMTVVNYSVQDILGPDQRVFVQRNAEPPALAPGEGAPAETYTFLRSVQFNSGTPFSVVNLHLDQRRTGG